MSEQSRLFIIIDSKQTLSLSSKSATFNEIAVDEIGHRSYKLKSRCLFWREIINLLITVSYHIEAETDALTAPPNIGHAVGRADWDRRTLNPAPPIVPAAHNLYWERRHFVNSSFLCSGVSWLFFCAEYCDGDDSLLVSFVMLPVADYGMVWYIHTW